MNGIEGLDRVLKRVSKISDNITRDIEKPLKAGSVYMLGSIERNFKASGRPTAWKPLAASTLARRRKGTGKGGSKILINFGNLKNSMSSRIRLTEAEVGTNAVQAKRQHFGYEGGTGRGHSKTPARPFVMFQTEDFDAIGQLFSRHIRR